MGCSPTREVQSNTGLPGENKTKQNKTGKLSNKQSNLPQIITTGQEI